MDGQINFPVTSSFYSLRAKKMWFAKQSVPFITILRLFLTHLSHKDVFAERTS